MEFTYMELAKLKVKFLNLAEKEKYELEISKKEKEMLCMFDCLNVKKETNQNIENFFEVLGELIEFEKGGGKV